MDGQQFFEATLIQIIQETEKVRRFVFKASEGGDFQPGQFVILRWDTPDGSVERSYSLSSFPQEWPVFELCIAHKEGGFASQKLWNLNVGQTIFHTLPQGGFLLFDAPGVDHVFVCTGTGIAPFRPMVHQLLNSGGAAKVRLIFGCRTQKDLLYANEWKQLAREYAGFEWHPVLSREAWEGAQGYVHAVYEPIYQGAPDARFYVCGWEVMLKEARQRLKALGYDRRKYRFESYD